MTKHRCTTCFRKRPEEEFKIVVSDHYTQLVPICRPCRVKLWDNPDDPSEAVS